MYRTVFWTLWERGEGGMIWENGIETCIISYKKWIVSPGSMQDTGSLGLVHWDGRGGPGWESKAYEGPSGSTSIPDFSGQGFSCGFSKDFLGGLDSKEFACNVGNLGSIPGLGRSPGEGNGTPLQYACLENPMDGGAWWATVHGVAKSPTQLSDFTSHFQ